LSRSEFAGKNLVHITPHPGLTGLDGANQGMLGFVKVFGGVFILRGIAATNVAANEAHAQVNPSIAELNAFLAHMNVGFSYLNFVEVSASFCHQFLLSSIKPASNHV
jgi:hypothetical protein